MALAALNIRCASPDGDVTVTVSPGGQTITLRDDGAGTDQEAGNGIEVVATDAAGNVSAVGRGSVIAQ